MKKSFLFKWVSVLGAVLLLATSVMPGITAYAYSDDTWTWDYVWNRDTWNDSNTSWALKVYYKNNPSEDVWNVSENRACNFNDKVYTAKVYTDDAGEGEYETKQFAAFRLSEEVQKITEIGGDENVYYIPMFYDVPGQVFEMFCNAPGGAAAKVADLADSSSHYIRIESAVFGGEGVGHAYDAWIANWAQAPWISIAFKQVFTWTIKFNYTDYQEGVDYYPRTKKIRTWWPDWKAWAEASIPEEFWDEYLVSNGATSFDLEKFTATLVPAYVVSFDTNWWTPAEIENQTILLGDNASKPEDPTKEWNILLWWFDGEDKFEFTTPITGAINLTARWEAMSDSTWWVETPDGETFTWVILEPEEPALTSSEESNITTLIASNNSTAAMEWVVELNVFKDMDWDGTKDSGDDLLTSQKVNFTSPKVVRIPVNTTWDVFIKVRHNGETNFSTDWLTTSSTATCSAWVATPAYVEGTPITPTSWYAEIYTCSASTFVAYTEIQNPAPTYWWGGSSWSSKKTETKAETWSVATWDTADVDAVDTAWAEEWINEETLILTAEEQAAVAKFWQEQIDAYKWALQNGITTMKTVEDARLDKPLTRAELAKMMVVYIQKVLEKEPAITGDVTYTDVSESLGDLAGYIKLAYQYQIMWINANGTPIEAFNPNGLVTRWEYATVFSRVLFGDKFNKEWADFYTNHLSALEKAKILTNTTPTIQEIRWWVMLMMYRSSQNADDIQAVVAETEESTEETVSIANPAAEYCVAQWWESIIKTDKDGSQYWVCKLADGTEVDEWEYFRANNTEETTSESTEETAE